MYRSGKKLILLHSNSLKVMNYWAKKSLNNLKKQNSANIYTGCFDEGFSNPTNAIFKIIEHIVFTYDERWYDENPSLNFYYFTNYSTDPELDIFKVPTPVFRFLAYIAPDERNNWNEIVKNTYYIDWSKKDSDKKYKTKFNAVYNNLLYNKSIMNFFYDSKMKKTLCS